MTRLVSEGPSVELCFSDSGFKLFYLVTLGADCITTTMTVVNTAAAPLEFTGALHTYFRVSNAVGSKVVGLQGASYEDNSEAGGGAICKQDDVQIQVTGDELDRVYLDTPEDAFIVDGERAIKVSKQGFADAVVWNIGEAKSVDLKDMGEGEWRQYVCFEAASVGKTVEVPTKAMWVGSQTFTRVKAADVPGA